MAAITWFMTNNLAGASHQEMSETDPGTEAYASPVTGWIVGTTVATRYASMDAQTEVAAASFGTTAQPDGSIVTTSGAGDCLRSTNTYNGSFAAANWVANLCIRAQTTAGGTSRGRVRLFRSVNADGSGATEITAAAQVCSTVTPATGTTTNSTVTFNPGAFTVTDEYIFIQIGWETVTAGSMTTNDVNFRVGNSASLGTRIVSSNFTANAVLAAGSNTITFSAPDVPAVHLTMPEDANVITITAPTQSQLVEITLASGQNTITLTAPAAGIDAPLGGTTLDAGTNTITLTAPTVPAVDLTMPQSANVITLSAPAQSQLAEITLAAGSNTITLSAPDVPAVSLTMPVSTNTITLSAPDVPAVSLTMPVTANVITLSAPDVPAVSLTMPVSTNTITLTAPTVPAVSLTMPVDTNIITLSAPAAEIVQAGNLIAAANVITITAPTVPAVNLTMPVDTNLVTLTAPNAGTVAEVSLLALASVITFTAPDASMRIDAVLDAGQNQIQLTAPTAQALVDWALAAGANVITISAPDAGIASTFDTVIEVGGNLITLRAPTVTLLMQLFGEVAQRHNASFKAVTAENAPLAPKTTEDAQLAWRQDMVVLPK